MGQPVHGVKAPPAERRLRIGRASSHLGGPFHTLRRILDSPMNPTAVSDRWITRPRPVPGARLRLFCLPHAGGGASTFREWPRLLPDSIEVCSVQLPGRETRIREQPFVEWRPLVDALAGAVAPWLDRPFAFFGHSAGALIAFELDRALRASGGPVPEHLFLSARAAPQLPRTGPTTWDLPHAALIEDLRKLGGTRDEVLANDELMQPLLQAVRADLAVTERYVFPGGDPVDAPITALAGQDDPRAQPAELEPWRRLTRGEFRLHVLPGGHFFIHTEPVRVTRIVAQELAPEDVETTS
jgi:medium-chain acyl-[acyl-carrier-protein] hydrolase